MISEVIVYDSTSETSANKTKALIEGKNLTCQNKVTDFIIQQIVSFIVIQEGDAFKDQQEVNTHSAAAK